MYINSRNSFKKVAEYIVRLYNAGNIEWSNVSINGVDYVFSSENDGLYIEATIFESHRVDDMVLTSTTRFGDWFLASEEVTVGGVFRAIYPRKGRYYSNSGYRRKVSNHNNRRPPFRY